MTKRRSFGSVRRLPSGRWQASYYHPITHQRINGPTTFGTKREATKWLALQEADLLRGDDIDPDGRDLLFKIHAERWLESKINLRPKTVELYSMLLRTHLAPTFGDYPLSRINRQMVQRWYTDKRSGRWSSSTVAKMYRLLRQILQAAVDDRLIRENPCRIDGAATERSRERQPPTVDEALQLIAAIDPRYRAMVALAGFAGLRRSECFGLACRHVDLTSKNRGITVERQKIWTDNGGYEFGSPKSDAGIRRVAIPGFVAAELRNHMGFYISDPSPDSLVFVGADGNTPSPTVWRSRWAQAKQTTGLEFRFHDLRHLAGTLNAQAGASIKEAMRRLGHSSPEAALRYQHAVDERDKMIADAVDEIIEAGEDSAHDAHEADDEPEDNS